MRNKFISHGLGGVEVFLKVPVLIIFRVGENNVLGQIYIDIYIYLFCVRAGEACTVYLTFLVYYS